MRIVPVLVALFCLLFATSRAEAGAWPREKGRVFASSAICLSWPQDIPAWEPRDPTGRYVTFYAEYGLTDRLTLGLDLGRSMYGDGKALVFLRLPLRDRDHGLRIATELGLGEIDGQPVIRPGLSLGFGLQNGWLSADGLAETRARDGRTDYKLDLTWGRNFPGGRKLILQIQSGKPGKAPAYARFAPSVVLPLNRRLKAEIGGAWGLSGDMSMGAMLGLWAEF